MDDEDLEALFDQHPLTGSIFASGDHLAYEKPFSRTFINHQYDRPYKPWEARRLEDGTWGVPTRPAPSTAPDPLRDGFEVWLTKAPSKVERSFPFYRRYDPTLSIAGWIAADMLNHKLESDGHDYRITGADLIERKDQVIEAFKALGYDVGNDQEDDDGA